MKFLLLIISLGFSTAAFSQDSLVINSALLDTRAFISLKSVQQKNIVLTAQDSLDFQFHETDTLVLITPRLRKSLFKGPMVRYQPKDSIFLKIYEDVVFGDQPNSQKNSIKVWKDDIKVFFDASVNPNHRKELMDFAEKIAAGIDSLNISETEVREESNYYIFYHKDSTHFDLEPRITGKLGGYYVNWNGRQEMDRGILKINTFDPAPEFYKLHLLKWYFFKSLGYFGNSSLLPCESFLSKCSKAVDISQKDLELLRYHYSYSNCIGNNREQFRKFHDKIRKSLKADPNREIFVVHP